MNDQKPEILAPAGDQNSFLAAVAAGADAVYCGLKIFSARMEADNFSIEQLSLLSKLAGSKGIKVYVAFNSIIKEGELDKVFNIISKLAAFTEIDALIVQDPAMIPIARQAGFKGQFHLSTLGNCTFPSGLNAAEKLGLSKVVLPREFTIDEVKLMARGESGSVELEMFVHGALCYSISGRCYWSSWFGGKSSLRGRCVQPCRRIYQQKGQKRKHFSCVDFSADVLAKVLKDIPNVTTWKIEGRKKSPHYVYHTVKAYRLLRDQPEQKKQALDLLDYAMGRELSHYNLLAHRRINPLVHTSETGSGLFAGRVKNPAAPYFITREELFVSDLLRIGNEEDPFHDIQKVTRAVPKKGKFYLKPQKGAGIQKGTPVYIIDRRDHELSDAIAQLEKELENFKKIKVIPTGSKLSFQRAQKKSRQRRPVNMEVFRGRAVRNDPASATGMWISSRGYSVNPSIKNWLWLDPVFFPEEEKKCAAYIHNALKKGARNFVLNAPWQISFFKNPNQLNLWAGPFCNITNTITIDLLGRIGFSGVIVSPELDEDTFMALPEQSGLPLGVVLYGSWPLGISRIISPDLKLNTPFQSPMGEISWITKQGGNYMIFPNWYLDLKAKKEQLVNSGYTMFVNLYESIPKTVKMKNRPGLWNWNLKLL